VHNPDLYFPVLKGRINHRPPMDIPYTALAELIIKAFMVLVTPERYSGCQHKTYGHLLVGAHKFTC